MANSIGQMKILVKNEFVLLSKWNLFVLGCITSHESKLRHYSIFPFA